MIEPACLQVRLRKRIHAGLTIDATIDAGPEPIVVFGPSGAGKTTLLRLIAGLERPDEGSVAVAGQTLFDSARKINIPLRRRGVGFVFQDDLLFPHLDVAANLGFGLDRRRASARVREVAAMVGASHLLGRRVETLSGGERQRVGLGRALAPMPRLLLCDEPVSALDVESRHALIALLREVQAASAIPALFVTHGSAEAVALGTRLIRLEAGKIVGDGPPMEVLAASGARLLDDLENRFRATILSHGPGGTRVWVDDGPVLVVPALDAPVGVAVIVRVRATDAMPARGPLAGLSARNQLPGRVASILPHGDGAEVVVALGGSRWAASIVGTAAADLGLAVGRGVVVVIKARSCRVVVDRSP